MSTYTEQVRTLAIDLTLGVVAIELENAIAAHGPMKSAHEAYAVIKEELDEFWEEVKRKKTSESDMAKEIIQIAAMCVRAMIDLRLPNPRHLNDQILERSKDPEEGGDEPDHYIEDCINQMNGISEDQRASLIAEITGLRSDALETFGLKKQLTTVERDRDLARNQLERLEALVNELKSDLTIAGPLADAWVAVRDVWISFMATRDESYLPKVANVIGRLEGVVHKLSRVWWKRMEKRSPEHVSTIQEGHPHATQNGA